MRAVQWAILADFDESLGEVDGVMWSFFVDDWFSVERASVGSLLYISSRFIKKNLESPFYVKREATRMAALHGSRFIKEWENYIKFRSVKPERIKV